MTLRMQKLVGGDLLRGDAPIAAARYWGLTQQEYYARADVWPLATQGEILVIIMCEEKKAIKNLPKILEEVKGIGVVLIGEGDLDFPTLKLIIPHGGGAVPYQFNRHRALHVREGRRPFEEMVRHLYFDTAIYDQDSMEMLIRKIGPDNVVFSTEMLGTAKAIDPKTGRYFDDTVGMVKSIEWLTDEDRYKIFEGNAKKLYSRAKW